MAGGVLYVKDLAVMAAFYESALGLATAHREDGVVILSSSDWDMALIQVPAAIASTIAISTPPERRAETPVKLVFDIADLDDAAARVTASGGELDANRWKFLGAWHLDAIDPEGNIIQLRQRG